MSTALCFAGFGCMGCSFCEESEIEYHSGVSLFTLLRDVKCYLSSEERGLIAKYHETDEEREDREFWEKFDSGYYDELAWDNSEIRLRDSSMAIWNSNLTFDSLEPSYGVGSSTSFVKRQTRRAFRRGQKEMIREQMI